MARPAASSAARLMRRPDESFSIDFDCAYCVDCRLRWALNASMLLLTRRDMLPPREDLPTTSMSSAALPCADGLSAVAASRPRVLPAVPLRDPAPPRAVQPRGSRLSVTASRPRVLPAVPLRDPGPAPAPTHRA